MKKILLIAYRDFIIRIRNKTFLISTLLLPIGIVLFYGTIFFFTSNDTDIHRIGLADEEGYLSSKLQNTKNFKFKKLAIDDTIRTEEFGEEMDIDAIVLVPNSKDSFLNGSIDILTYTKLGLMTKNRLERKIQNAIESERFAKINIDSNIINEIQEEVPIIYESVSGSDENALKEGIAFALSFGLGIMMYIILTIYGSQVMRGVMEEKTNRIVEIIISSVKPFELLMGKIIGIGAVSFLQLIIWGVFLGIINLSLAFVFGVNEFNSATSSMPISQIANQASSNPEILEAINNIQSFNFLPIVLLFIFYFLGGYFLYSSLFAAVGSAVGDDPQDVQALMFPIMIPILLSFVFLSKSVNNPNCTEAVIASIVPFTSPVVMMSRVVFGIPEGVPLWQLILSMVILIVSTVLLINLAARIYKVGILLYGKKVSWKQMIQWIFVK